MTKLNSVSAIRSLSKKYGAKLKPLLSRNVFEFGTCGAVLGQVGAKVEPSLSQVWAKMSQVGTIWAKFGASWANVHDSPVLRQGLVQPVLRQGFWAEPSPGCTVVPIIGQNVYRSLLQALYMFYINIEIYGSLFVCLILFQATFEVGIVFLGTYCSIVTCSKLDLDVYEIISG